ncbi:HAD-IA family hydrolase [bacterium]|nr:HAD-IA family hydrolase [bacterium]
MKGIKFIYFDIGGVLLYHINSLKTIARKYSLLEKDVLKLFNDYGDDLDRGTLGLQKFEEIFYSKLKPSLELKNSFFTEFVSNLKSIKETYNLVLDLQSRFKIGLLSNIPEDLFDLIANKNLLPNIKYSVVVKSGQLKMIKPEKQIFEYALKKSGVLPSQILFIDDTKVNLQAAEGFGFNTYLFNTLNPKQSVAEINNILLL